MTPACGSKPSLRAWRGRAASTQGASGSAPSRSTRAPARGPERDPALHRGAREAGQRERLGGERIGGLGVVAEPAAPEQPPDPPRDRSHQPGDVGVDGRREAVEAERPIRPGGEDAVEPEDVEVNVELQPRPKTLHDRHRAALARRDAGPPAPPAVPPEHDADEDAQHGAAEGVVEGEAVAQAVRHGEDPLPHRHDGQHGVDEVRGLLRHAPAATARTDGPRFTGERDEALEGAVVAPDAAKTPAERPAPEDVPELALDEGRDPGAVGRRGRLVEEAVEVRAHDLVEHRPGRRPRRVDSGEHAEAQPRPCRRSEGDGASASGPERRSCGSRAATGTETQYPFDEPRG